MKTEGQIRQKVKQVVFRHRKEFVRQGLSKKPSNCKYNRKIRLPIHMSNRATLRVCQYCPKGEDPLDIVCDDTMGGLVQAENCPYFESLHTPEDLKEEFNLKLGLSGEAVEIGYIAKEYPDIAALMWVIGSDKDSISQDEPSSKNPTLLAFFGELEDSQDPPPNKKEEEK